MNTTNDEQDNRLEQLLADGFSYDELIGSFIKTITRTIKGGRYRVSVGVSFLELSSTAPMSMILEYANKKIEDMFDEQFEVTFIEEMKETRDSYFRRRIEANNFYMFEEEMFREFEPLFEKYGYTFSVQAAYDRACSPSGTHSLAEYHEMEVNLSYVGNVNPVRFTATEFLEKLNLTNVANQISEGFIEQFDSYYDGESHKFVPVRLIERLYLTLKEARFEQVRRVPKMNDEPFVDNHYFGQFED